MVMFFCFQQMYQFSAQPLSYAVNSKSHLLFLEWSVTRGQIKYI